VTLVAPVGRLKPPLPSFTGTLLTVNGSTARLSSPKAERSTELTPKSHVAGSPKAVNLEPVNLSSYNIYSYCTPYPAYKAGLTGCVPCHKQVICPVYNESPGSDQWNEQKYYRRPGRSVCQGIKLPFDLWWSIWFVCLERAAYW